MPREFMLVYAPRGVEEVENVVQIVAASVWWVSGLDVLGQGKEAVLGGGKERVGDERMEEEGGGRECWGCRARRSGEGWQWGKGMKKDRMIGSA